MKKAGEPLRPSAFIVFLFVYCLEIILAYTAHRANPIIRYILKRRAWLDAVVRVAYRWVVHPIANRTYILFHDLNAFI